MAPPSPPVELAFRLAAAPDTAIHLCITDLGQTALVYVATATAGAAPATAPLGSLVLAMPDPLSTALYTRAGSVDFATRLAKILSRKLAKPVYAGGEVKFWVAEEEAAAMRGCVQAVLEAVK